MSERTTSGNYPASDASQSSLPRPLAVPPPLPLYIELPIKTALASVSCMIASLITNPVDLIKTRQQLASKKQMKVDSYNVMKQVVKSEGIVGLYGGLSAALLREAIYSGFRIGAYDPIKRAVVVQTGWKDTDGRTKLTAGLISGMGGAVICNPVDLLKIRLQAAPPPTFLIGEIRPTLRSTARDIYSSEGIKGFYRATGPTALRAGFVTSAQIGTYDHAKHTIKTKLPVLFPGEGFKLHLAASAVAGLACSLASAPIDVVKVRLMNDSQRQYRNSIDCSIKMIMQEGPLSIYRGFSMCFFRLWPHTVISLLIFEQLRKVVGIAPV